MHITRYTDYSLRVLMYLAAKGDTLSTIKEIADSYQISKNHLMKIVQELNTKGYVIAVRGKNGGLKLKNEPSEINIGDLVRDIEQDLSLVECFKDGANCIITPGCQLKVIFDQALTAFLEKLDEYTLADLIPDNKRAQISQLLNIAG
ncbi:RrF2 family transcriptional regulator [Aliikangiella coralliicola]|uniref:Rrf2 family transcriptional regulator n=1 Tax=Aliikangiella coralliicola TaxID=2592383 RepID=A0A545U4H9_9GAMM|nr:Rrf2 family transcriptional regulator [Aliikangiella coralliicola]TQV84381.1 Rrf2 family transcriptional regulator [Aliikangiella coralliicola]